MNSPRALLPEPEVGSQFEIELVREGKEAHQAVGYMRDGSMVVVNKAHRVGSARLLLWKLAVSFHPLGGKMIFADLCDI